MDKFRKQAISLKSPRAGPDECNGEWLLKNSDFRNSRKFHRARMPYKRFSIFVDIFYLFTGTVFSKEGVFQQPRDVSSTKKVVPRNAQM